MSAGLIKEMPAPSDETSLFWREAGKGERLALRATAAGLDAIRVDPVASEEITEGPTEVSTDSQDGVEPHTLPGEEPMPNSEAAQDAPDAPERANWRITLRKSV